MLSNPERPVETVKGKRLTTPEYRAWQAMKNRCLNPHGQDYSYYGGRGIAVCPEWAGSFTAFYADMGERPGQDYTLDRVNGDKGYGPGNTRWATRLTQARNREYCALICILGKKRHVWEWASLLKVKPTTVHHWLWRVKRGELAWGDLERRVRHATTNA